MEIFYSVVAGNSVAAWLGAAGLFILGFAALLLLRSLLLRRLEKQAVQTPGDVDGLFRDSLSRTRALFLLVVALWTASHSLSLEPGLGELRRTVMIIALLLQAAGWGLGLINYLIQRRLKAGGAEDPGQATTLGALSLVAKFALWSIIILLILENVTGIQVDSLIASLGITGIAVALAVQNILGDLFASLSIALDKPFVIGDVIVVDDLTGTVEHIGLKSTRLRSLSGEEIVFSNSDLLNSRIRNFKRMQRRRVLFILGVSYATPYEKLIGLPEIVQEIISNQEQATFDRAHFSQINQFSLDFECVYYVEASDITAHVQIQHAINLALIKKLSEEEIEIPFPTQTLLFGQS
jgi:small-conductance mechanosensitive channel